MKDMWLWVAGGVILLWWGSNYGGSAAGSTTGNTSNSERATEILQVDSGTDYANPYVTPDYFNQIGPGGRLSL